MNNKRQHTLKHRKTVALRSGTSRGYMGVGGTGGYKCVCENNSNGIDIRTQFLKEISK